MDRNEAFAKFRWPLAAVAVAALVWLAWRETLRTAADAAAAGPNAVKAAARDLSDAAARFQSGTITTTFLSAIPALAPGGRLELAALRSTETFSRADEKRILWDWVSLGTTVTEIKVPVTFRYHLRLSDPWKLEIQGHACVVRAPKICATLPPAIHTDGMEKKTERGWLRFNASEQMDTLEKSLTAALSTLAEDPRHVALAREECRKATADFVRAWLLKEDFWRTDRFSSIRVVFPDDPPDADDAPTLRLEER